MLLTFLAIQSLVFAAWVVVSLAILIGVASRSVRGDTGLSGGADPADAVRDYLGDPLTRFRRRTWLALTGVLFACTMATGVLLLTA